MSHRYRLSRRQFLGDAVCAGFAVAMGNSVNAAASLAEVHKPSEIHVSTANGDDSAAGSAAHPLKTISAAAEKAMPGDTIIVHAGVYRERVDPPRGGTDDAHRITYTAAKGEKVVITGSESVKGWVKMKNDTWKLVLPKTFFKDFNPFAGKVSGEWCNRGSSTGMVYLSGEWMAEAASKKAVLSTAGASPLWFAETGDVTTVYAQFKNVDPNSGAVEIAARQSVFYPSKPGIGFITVRGFEMCNAATPWAGAMSEQVGLVGTHWSKGWIIEDNDIHHSLCTGVTLGRYLLPTKEFPATTAPGFTKSVELALRDGWSKEKVGSHIVRRNHIHHCEKNGIHGSLGAAFSEVSENDIHDIACTGWLEGPDLAGIKFLGGVDMIIRDNHIHHCGGGTFGGVSGMWLDWMCQGAIVTGNLLHDNAGSQSDIFLEMQHGPLLLTNNICLSGGNSITIDSEGMALAHNLAASPLHSFADVELRATPFQPAHKTDISGTFTACGGDHRFFNNILFGRHEGTHFSTEALPSVAEGNLFAGKNAEPFAFGAHASTLPDALSPRLMKKADGLYLMFAENKLWRDLAASVPVSTKTLGKAKITACSYENTDGSPLVVDTDYFGKKRDTSNPFPGPFESPVDNEVKVWPKRQS